MRATPISAHIYLDEKQLSELERLSALGYSVEDMALYFNADERLFKLAAEDEASIIARHIKRGQLTSLAREQMAILQAAELGGVKASEQLMNIKRNRSFKISKKDIYSGFEDLKQVRVFEDWVEGGCKGGLNKEEEIYLQALSMMNSLDRKYGRKGTIEYFIKTAGLKYSRAAEMYDEAVNLFNADRKVEKKAYRNKYAEICERVALVLEQNLEGPKDAVAIERLINRAAAFRELDKKDPDPLPKELFIKPVRYFSLDTATIGQPGINRQLVAKQIDELDIPESDKTRVRADALLTQLNLEENLDELEEEAKTR